jgi:hypothetical protein
VDEVKGLGQDGVERWGRLTPQHVTRKEALELIAAKAEQMRKRGRDPYAVSGLVD